MDETTLDERYRVILIIWAALAGGVILFTGIVWALTSGFLGDSGGATLEPGLVLPILGLCVLFMVGGIVLRRSELGRTEQDPFVAWQRGAIVAWAVQEGAGLFALSLCFLAARPSWALLMGGLSVISMLLTRPDRSELERIARGR